MRDRLFIKNQILREFPQHQCGVAIAESLRRIWWTTWALRESKNDNIWLISRISMWKHVKIWNHNTKTMLIPVEMIVKKLINFNLL